MLRILLLISSFWSISLMAEDLPKWVDSPFQYCSSKYLCAVGEGTGKLVAEASARNELAKIFKVEISGRSQFEQSETSVTSTNGGLQGQVNSAQNTFLKESVDEVLEGIEITEVYKSDDSFFALARLNKRSASDRFKRQMNSLDDEIKVLMDQNKRSSFFKAYKILLKREAVNQRYHILNQNYYSGRYSKRSILSKLEEKKKKTFWSIFLKIMFLKIGDILY